MFTDISVDNELTSACVNTLRELTHVVFCTYAS